MNEQDSRQVLELYGDLVYRLAYARTGKREDAEDIFQEVFVTYVRKHPSFADEGAGLSAKETAKALGISANAVGIRLNRGRKMLKERLQEGGTHESGKTSEFS